ncbi:MAG: hypothetical protein QOC59_743 [Microbacteriaceae bacterium]|nr:hypothetical protein [Microbacteriaceae bacterium]
MPASTLTLIGKPGCHLCDDAREVVDGVLDELGREGVAVRLVERSILDEPALAAAYADDIPVVLVDDRVHGRWRVDAERLRADLIGG